MHPTKYLRGLADAIDHRGGRIFTMTHASGVEGGAHARVETAGGPVVTAMAVVVATNTPVIDRVTIHTKQAAYRTYVIGVPVPAGSIQTALWWDTGDPYHYLRLCRGDGCDLLIVGGEDHKTGQAEDDERACLARLEAWTAARFPEAGAAEHAWSGQVMEPIDGLAFIGRNPGDERNVYVATGDSGNGMTHGTIAGMMLSDMILGRESPWAELYDPARKPMRAAKEFLKENLNVAARYADHVRGGEIASTEELPPGTGAVLRRGTHRIAVRRDAQGVLHELSAVCPHLGCIVSWNAGESTWDCPCHGSRFDADGAVLNGPANRGLDPAPE
jgi:Rieske Fe-S protein